jgi:hypothetical protein
MPPSFRATAEELLELNRVRHLLFGIYTWRDDDESYRVEEAGSGILVAQEHGLTARHVMEAFSKFDPQFEARRRSTRGIFAKRPKPDEILKSAIPAAVYQENEGSELVQWWPRVAWQSEHTDISVLVMRPTTAAAERRARNLNYLDWQLLPPKVGAKVRVYGWPRPEIDVRAGVHDAHVELWMRPAVVIEHVPVLRAHGFQEFPGYIIDKALPPAMSGGAVLHNGRLSGIFTGPDYASSLWPLALMRYPLTEDFFVDFAEHLDHDVIRAIDWDQVKGRVQHRECDRIDCLRKHVVLVSKET